MSEPTIPVSEVERIFDAWCQDLVAHHGDKTVASVLSSPAIQSMFTGDLGQTALALAERDPEVERQDGWGKR